MAYKTDIVYRYDGTYEGFLSCVFESYEKRELPCAIARYSDPQGMLLETRRVMTDPERAARVERGLRRTAGSEVAELMSMAFLTCMDEKERKMLAFARLAMSEGPKAANMLTDDTVAAIRKAVSHLASEAHLLKGFVRFQEVDGALAAEISPKNEVLPLLAPHFAERYVGERLIICDLTHEQLLLCAGGESAITARGDFAMPKAGSDELRMQALWKRFYAAICNQSRINPRLRMSMMPKRYWQHMTEMKNAN